MKGFLLRTISLVLFVVLTHVNAASAQEISSAPTHQVVETSYSDSAINIPPEPTAQPNASQAAQKAPVSNTVTFATKEVLLDWLNLLFVTGMMLVLLGIVAIHRASKKQVQ